jgi:hypothetical protein
LTTEMVMGRLSYWSAMHPELSWISGQLKVTAVAMVSEGWASTPERCTSAP